MRKITYKDASAEALLMAMEKDKNVFLIGEGVDNITGVYCNTLPAYQRFGPERVIDTPLSENGLTGFCIGAALNGMRPVLIHQRNDFMLLAMDQMFNQAAKMRYASGGRHKVPITILRFAAKKPGEGCQHSQSLHSIFAHFPGIKVGMPTTPADVKGMLLTAIFDDNPVIILEHRELFEEKQTLSKNYYTIPYRARVAKEGIDLTIVATSVAVRDAIKAAKISEKRGISAEVIDLRWVKPLDTETIIDSIKKTGKLIVVDTGWKSCSISSDVIALAAERAHGYLDYPPPRIALPDAPCPASQYLESLYHPNTEIIVQVIEKLERRK